MDYSAYGASFRALSDISLTINKGEFVSFIGPSGCGKSTLLDIIAGLIPPSEGEVRIDNSLVTGPGPDRGVVFQDYSLFPWMSVLNNIIFAIEHTNGLNGSSAREKAIRYLDAVGLTPFQDTYPGMLSGGMRQRLAIARMFAMSSQVFLMDEPFGALDSLNRIYMQELLLHLWRSGEDGKTVLLVTHDVDEAIFLSDRIIVISPSPGRIIEEIHVPFRRPRDRERIIKADEYLELRSRLLSILFGEMVEQLALQQEEIRALA